MIVDSWIQHPTGAMLGDPMFASLRRWMGITDVPDLIPPEFTLGALDAAGIDVALASAWVGPQGPLIPNEAVAELIARDPERIVGIASVDLNRPMDAVRELRHWVKKGFGGLRVLPWLWQIPPDDRRYYPLYAECIELGVPFCTQVGHAGPLRPSEPGRPIPYLEQVAYEWPELTIVGGHVGSPWFGEMLSLLRKYDNVYVDTSAYKPSRFPPELTAYLRGSGRTKVLYGSNWPMIPPASCLEQVDSLELDDATRALFLGGNAARVYGLEGR